MFTDVRGPQITYTLAQQFKQFNRIPRQGALFRDAHHSLGPLYPAITKYTSKGKAFAIPSLFDCYASIVISSSALQAHNLLTPSPVDYPPFPTDVAGACSHTITFLLQSLDGLSVEIPSQYRTEKGELPDVVYQRTAEVLVEWVYKCLSNISSPVSGGSSGPDRPVLLKIMRSMVFLYSALPNSPMLSGHALYRKTISVFAAHAIQNYSSLVLKPLVEGINSELGLRNDRVGSLVSTMLSVIKVWSTNVSYMTFIECMGVSKVKS